MKKKIISMLFGVMLAVSSVFAFSDPDVDPEIVEAFNQEFSFAKNIKWETEGDLFRVRFSINDQGFVAWYNEQAELISTARTILFMQLPLAVIKSFEKNYEKVVVLSITEVTRDDETTYLIKTEDGSTEWLLKAYPSGRIDRVKKLKK